jgi:protein transport protein YIF1
MSSPPPLRHPVPTHPAYIPEPPVTPGSPQGYQRFASSPQPGHDHGGPGGPGVPYPTQVPAYNVYSQGPSPPHPQQHPQQQHPQQQQQQGAPINAASFIPATFAGAWGMNESTAQFGFQLGSSAVAAGQDYVDKNLNLSGRFAGMKKNFDVSNSYVLAKLGILLFPWRHKSWNRKILQTTTGGGGGGAGGADRKATASPSNGQQQQVDWQSPRDDVNAPDLYIPLMAVVTYILVAAFHSGLQDRFHPSVSVPFFFLFRVYS